MEASLKSVLGTLRADGVLGTGAAATRDDERKDALSCSISISSDEEGCASDLVDFELIKMLSANKLLRVKACAARDDEDALYLAVANVTVRDKAELELREGAIARLLLKEHRAVPYTLLFECRPQEGCERVCGGAAWVQSSGSITWATRNGDGSGGVLVSSKPGASVPSKVALIAQNPTSIVPCTSGAVMVSSLQGVEAVRGSGEERKSVALKTPLASGSKVLAMTGTKDGCGLFVVNKISTDEGTVCKLLYFSSQDPTSPVVITEAPKSCTAIATDATTNAAALTGGGKVYMTDTTCRCVRQLGVKPADAGLRGEGDGSTSEFVSFEGAEGIPIDVQLDSNSDVWIALWFGWQVVRVGAKRNILQRIHLPVPNPVGISFGGPTRDTLFIVTSADVRGALGPLAPEGFDSKYTGADAGAGGIFKVVVSSGGMAKRDCKVAFGAVGHSVGEGVGGGGGGGGGAAASVAADDTVDATS